MKDRMISAIAMTRLCNGSIGKIDGLRNIIRGMANMMNDSNADNCKYTMEFADESEYEDDSVILPEVIISLKRGKKEN